MADAEDRFMAKYHKAVVAAFGDRLENAKARIASDWVGDWAGGLEAPVEDREEFRRRFEDFLRQDLGFAGRVDVSISGDELTVGVEECRICPGNEALRQQGRPTLCPMLSTGLLAVSRVLGERATLLDVEKDGRVGQCTIRYRLEKK